MEDNVVWVVGLDKHTGFNMATTSCDKEDAQKYAKYYRNIGYNARVFTYDELDKMLEEEMKYRTKYGKDVQL